MGKIGQGGQKIIVALDVDSVKEAEELVEALMGHVLGFKIGRQFADSVGTPKAIGCVKGPGGILFFDGKIHDIPNSVAGDVRAIISYGVDMLNVHTTCGLAAMQAAVKAIDEIMSSNEAPVVRPILLGVTALTSLSYSNFVRMGLAEPITGITDPDELATEQGLRMEEIVVMLAKLAQEARMDGVIASPREIRAIRERCGDDFTIATPGVRPIGASQDDQARVMTPEEAIGAGADYVIIGRPIRQDPDGMTPVEAADSIAHAIAEVL